MPVLAYSTKGNFDINKIEKSGFCYWVGLQKGITQYQDKIPVEKQRLYRNLWAEYEGSTMPEQIKTRTSDINKEVEELIMSSVTKWMNEGYEVYTMSDFVYSNEFLSFSEEQQKEIIDNMEMYANKDYGDIYSKSFMLVKYHRQSSSCPPLVSAKWGQLGGYNKFTPHEYPVGCVAVAMGQIMKYHRYPATFNWNDMPDFYPTETTAQFLRDIGTAVNMNYNIDGSYANINDALNAFKYTFGYTKARKIKHDYNEVIKQLERKRPVFMTGSRIDGSERVGHAWVCDGYYEFISNKRWELKTLEDTPSGIVPKKFTTAFTHDSDLTYGFYFYK